MTLAIYLPCKDAYILICDRLELHDDYAATASDKILISSARDFAVAGAGNSEVIEHVFSKIRQKSDTNGDNIEIRFEEILNDLVASGDPLMIGEDMQAHFIVLSCKTNGIRGFYGRITPKYSQIRPLSENTHFCIGVGEKLVEYLSQAINYQEIPLLEAIPRAIAMVQEVTTIYPVIGKLERYGFDVIAFTRDRKVFVLRNFRKKIAEFNVVFKKVEGIDAKDFDITDLGALGRA